MSTIKSDPVRIARSQLAQVRNIVDKLESIKETGCDTSPAIKSISVQ